MMKKNKKLWIAVCAFAIALFSACGSSNAGSVKDAPNTAVGSSAASSEQGTAADSSAEAPAVQETAAQLLASGKLYEITENNFQDQFKYEFSEEELASLEQLLGAETPAKGTETCTAKYIVHLYDSSESLVYELQLDASGNAFDADGAQYTSPELTALFAGVIAKNN